MILDAMASSCTFIDVFNWHEARAFVSKAQDSKLLCDARPEVPLDCLICPHTNLQAERTMTLVKVVVLT